MTRKTERMQSIDSYVGSQIKFHRINHGLSQEKLASRVGISYQQLHKYETGANGVSASRLAELAKALEVNPGHFFQGMEHGEEAKPYSSQQLQFMKYFNRIPSARQRDAIQLLIRVLGDSTLH